MTVSGGPTHGETTAARQWLRQRRAAVVIAARKAAADNVPRLASSLAYLLVFAAFPALISVAALLELTGVFASVLDDALAWIAKQPADSPWQALRGTLESVAHSETSAWPLLVFGVVVTVWTVSNYIGGYAWAIGIMRGAPEKVRGVVTQRLLQIALAALAFVVGLLTIAVAFLTGPVAAHVGDAFGLGEATQTAWSWARWPLLFVVLAVLFAAFYQVAPGARRRGLGLFTTGSVVAIVGWLLVTAGFSVYVKYFADYNRFYGTLGAFIAFLVWLWLFNVALLISTEIDVALEDVRRERYETRRDARLDARREKQKDARREKPKDASQD
jgi:membrane protein